MKISNKVISYFLLSIFTLYSLNHYIFERRFYFNELLSLSGLLLLLFNSISFKESFNKSVLFKTVILFVGYGFVVLFFSLYFKTNWYYYLRNSVIVYSAFSFFVGYYTYTHHHTFFKYARIPIIVYLLYCFIFPDQERLIDRASTSFLFPLLLNTYNLTSLFLLILVNIWYSYAYEALTVIVLLAIVVFIITIRKKQILYSVSAFGVIVFIIGFIYFIPYLQNYKQGAYKLYGNLSAVTNSHPLLNADHNSTWRAMFWYRVLVEKYPSWVVGIGMGTPMLPYRKHEQTTETKHKDEYNAHVTGAHNTFITLLVRMGMVSLFFWFVIYRKIIHEFYTYREYYIKNANDFLIFISFISITVVGLFNLLLESPTLASVYWVILGFTAKVIESRESLMRTA
jgi:hypothetical protein